MFNASTICYSVFELNDINYPLLTIVFLVEIVILFRGPFMALVTIALTILLHLFAFRAIVISIFSNIHLISQKQIVSNFDLFLLTFTIAVVAHIVALILFIIIFKPKDLKIIIDNVELLSFVAPIALMVQFYLIFNKSIFMIDIVVSEINTQQIILPIFLVACFYITLFMTLRFIQLHGYKKKNLELEEKINESNVIKDAFFSASDIILEINCTEDKINRFLVDMRATNVDELTSYSDFLNNKIKGVIHSNSIEILEIFSVDNIISNFQNGITQLGGEFRSLKPYVTEENKIKFTPSEYRWFKINIKTQRNKSNENIISLFTIDDVTEQKLAEIELRKNLELDPLTGMYNRVGISTRINKHLADGDGGSLFMFDLDNFKGINDNMGHNAGDKVLIEVCEKVFNLFRSHDLVARIGGDEFNIFLPSLTDLDIIKKKAQLICDTVEKVYCADNGVEIKLSSSIGVCRAPKDANSYIELVKYADIAMYESKHRGKNTYTIFDSEIHKSYNPKSKEEYQR